MSRAASGRLPPPNPLQDLPRKPLLYAVGIFLFPPIVLERKRPGRVRYSLASLLTLVSRTWRPRHVDVYSTTLWSFLVSFSTFLFSLMVKL